MDFVLDGSVTMAWYFQDEWDAYADSVRGSLTQARALVPGLWPLEVANVLCIGERRGRSTLSQATQWLAILEALPIALDDETAARAWHDTLALARTHGLTAYDAAYLELAIRRGLPIATLDSKLQAGAAAAGVPLYQPDPAGGASS